MALLVTFLAVWATMVGAPRTPIGQLLHRCLVERVAVATGQLTRGHLALAMLLGVIASVVLWMGEADGLRMASMAAPEVATWITTFEVATYLDVAIGAITAWTGLRAGKLPFLAIVLRRFSVRRRRRAGRTRLPRVAGNDDDLAAPVRAAA